MPIYFMTTALLIVSLVTNLTVEGIKKLLNETTIKYSSNVLAAVVAVLMSCAVCVIYLIMNDVAFTLKVGVEVCILMYLSFLTSTVGYDKVIQMIQQIRDTKEDTTHEYTSTGAYNRSEANRTSVTPKKRDYLFGYDLVKSTSSPSGRVSYPDNEDPGTKAG